MWCQNFRNYQHRILADPHWKTTRDIVWKKSSHYCILCHKPFHLEYHHISYKRICTKNEWRDVKLLCDTHHRSAGFVLWFIKIPNKYLRLRYYQLRVEWVIFIFLVKITKWFLLSYVYQFNSVQRRRIEKWGRF